MTQLSIIIPTLNEAEHITDFLNKLHQLCQNNQQQQSLFRYEVILVDGGSCDQTYTLAKDKVDIILKSNKGRAIQQNTGAAKATGEMLLFLHADTLLPKKFIKEIISVTHSPTCVWGHFDVRLSGDHVLLRVVELMLNWRSRISHIATGDQCIFVKREVFEKIGGFASLQLMEDIELSSRLKKISKAYCSKLKVISSSRKWEQYGIIKTIVLMWWYRLQFFFGVSSKKLEQQYYSR